MQAQPYTVLMHTWRNESEIETETVAIYVYRILHTRHFILCWNGVDTFFFLILLSCCPLANKLLIRPT